MKYLYYPGCTLKNKAKDLDMYAKKSAEILVKVRSMTQEKRQTITPDEFRHLAKDFGVNLPEEFLFEK